MGGSRRARFDVYQGRGWRWYWRLVAANGEIAGPSQGYASRSSAVRAIRRLPVIAIEALRQFREGR